MPTNLDDQERKNILELDVETVARIAFRYMKEHCNSYLDRRNFSPYIESLRRDLFLGGERYQSRPEDDKFLEAITLLERRGLVVRNIAHKGRGGYEDQFHVYLTSIGIKSNIDGEVILLVDKPEEIVIALEQKGGTLDPVVRQYYLESLRAYQEGLYISSVICLGAASERAIHWLAESIESYYKQYQGKFKAKRNMPDLIKYLSDSVIPNIFGADKNFADELKKRLNGLGNLYRENRNEAGHPQTVDQSWLGEDQEYLLIQFRRYITTICEAIGRLN